MASLGGLFGGSTLTSPKSGIKAAQRGYDQSTKAIKEGSANLKDYTNKANDTLENYTSKGISAVQDYSNEARKSLNTGMDYVDQGTSQASSYYQQAHDLYNALAAGDKSAWDMYLNSLGLNGESGNTTATNTFQTSPGYQFQVDEANKNILRNGAATGNVLSGNVGIALNDRARQLANQEYSNWQDRLMNQGNNIYNDYAAQAAQLDNLANLYSDAGTRKASLSQDIASVDTQEGNTINSAYQSQGSQTAANQTSLGSQLNENNNTLAKSAYQRAQDIFGAQTSAAANQQAQDQAFWNSLLGLGGTALSAAGNTGGFSKLFG